MNTGMPNGRAIRTPAPESRDPPSGALPATRRCYVLERDNRCREGGVLSLFEDTTEICGQLSEAWPTLPGMGDEGTTPASTATAEPPERPPGPSLSPSRAGDFLTCPLLYRFRVIDRLPEPPSAAAVRGTLVHAVLERLFDRVAADRTPEAARALMEPEWSRMLAAEPELATLFEDDDQRALWLDEVSRMLDRYFTLEDPRRIEPAHRELCVEAELASGLRLRGYVDRLDVAPGGEMRIVDYK